MTTSTIAFISQVKLGELRRQRTLLLEAYARLAEEVANKTPAEGLQALYEGLQKVRVAGKPLHPDLGNLELLMQGSAPSREIVVFWTRRLEAEVATGRLRADIVYLFGALLGEWSAAGAATQSFLEERREAHESLLARATTPSEDAAPRAAQLLAEVFAGFGDALRPAPDRIAKALEKKHADENLAIVSLLDISRDIYQPAAIRQEAKRFDDDSVLRRQYLDALGVVTREPYAWTWPSGGIATRALWTRNKWRLYLNLSLVEMGIVSSFCHYWTTALTRVYSDSAQLINRLSRLQKLLDLNAPDVILENERRMARQAEEGINLGWYEPLDPWDGTPPIPADKKVAGIMARRATEQGELRQSGGAYYGEHGASQMLRLVHAEVTTLRTAFPERPLFVARLDIRDYFATLPHSVLLEMLRSLGLADDALAAIRRYLEVPYLVEGQLAPAVRGVPMAQHLSHFLAEWLLRLMERYVHSQARVRIIRQIDDICLLAAEADQIVTAWRAVQLFLADCGLAINEEKCGASALGAALPSELPIAPPRWGLVELTPQGEWVVSEPAFAKFREDARAHVSARHALLAKVTLYNGQLRYLASAVGLALDLGDGHRASVNEALRRFDAQFFLPDLGIVAGLRGAIADRYLGETELAHLPEGWLYWPITAGGLGLHSAFVLAGQYQQAFAERRKNRVPAPAGRPVNWQHGASEWTAYYEDLLQNMKPAGPRESKVMKTLVDDFIARGQEISGGKQQSLSEYWRWVLCIHGPEILDRFGTFRFLLTDLVPLQLIHEQLLHDGSFGDEEKSES